MPTPSSSQKASPAWCLSSQKEQNIQNALRRIQSSSDKLSIPKVAIEEGCDASTIYNRLKRTRSSALDAWGRRQKLSPELEEVIYQMALNCSRRYQPTPPSFIKQLAEELLRSTGHPEPSLGIKWPAAFRKRHPQLNAKWQEIGAPGGSKVLKASDISDYFTRLHDALEEKSIPYDQIYNMDETGFQLNEKSKQFVYTDRVANPRGFSKQMAQQNNITAVEVIRNSSSDPLPVPAYLILKGNHSIMTGSLFKKGANYENLRIIKTKTGFQSTHTMLDWLQVFIDSTKPNDPRQWRLLLLDGYSGHKSLELERLAMDNRLLLFSMPPNATSLLQPLDVGVFLGLKAEYKRLLQESQLKHEQARFPVTEFVAEYSIMRSKAMTSSVVTQAFKRCGITTNGLNPRRVLNKMPSEARTPSPQPQDPISPYVDVFTPRSYQDHTNILRDLAQSTPRRQKHIMRKSEKGWLERDGKLFKATTRNEAFEEREKAREDDNSIRPVRVQVSGSQGASQMRDLLVEREARLVNRPRPRPGPSTEVINNEIESSELSELDSSDSEPNTPNPVITIDTSRSSRPSRAAARSNQAILAELRNTQRIGRSALDESDFLSTSTE
ncbi:unnamed protein product [Sympodiomycopsis kandeliae]